MKSFCKNRRDQGVHTCDNNASTIGTDNLKSLSNIHPIKGTRLLINGELVDSTLGTVRACINPSNGEVVINLPTAGAVDLSAAMYAARRTYDRTNWPRIPPSHRCDYMSKLAELILEKKSLLTYLQALDGGATRVNSRTDVDAAVDILIQQSHANRQQPPYPSFAYEQASKATFNKTLVEPQPIASSPKSTKDGGLKNTKNKKSRQANTCNRAEQPTTEYSSSLPQQQATYLPPPNTRRTDLHHTLPAASGCGVVIAIISSHRPYLTALAEVIAPAIVAGDSVILLVSDDAPLVALELAAIVYQIEFPKGTIQVLVGSLGMDGMRVAQFVQRPCINKVIIHSGSMTTETISEIFPQGLSLPLLLRTASASNPWRIQFLGDAESCEPIPSVRLLARGDTDLCATSTPVIVCSDADVSHAASTICRVAFQSLQGYRHPHIILVVDDVFDEFVEAARNRAIEEKVGDPFQVSTTVGPLCSKAHFHRAMAGVERLIEDPNVTLVTGGCRSLSSSTCAKGYFIEPTIFTEDWRGSDGERVNDGDRKGVNDDEEEDQDSSHSEDEDVSSGEEDGAGTGTGTGRRGQCTVNDDEKEEERSEGDGSREGYYPSQQAGDNDGGGGGSEKYSTEANEGTPRRRLVINVCSSSLHHKNQLPLSARTTSYGYTPDKNRDDDRDGRDDNEEEEEEEEEYGVYGLRSVPHRGLGGGAGLDAGVVVGIGEGRGSRSAAGSVSARSAVWSTEEEHGSCTTATTSNTSDKQQQGTGNNNDSGGDGNDLHSLRASTSKTVSSTGTGTGTGTNTSTTTATAGSSRSIDKHTQHTLVGGGPVLRIIRTQSCDEAIDAANSMIASSMGAAGSSCVSVYTERIDTLSRVSWSLRADVVCANRIAHQRETSSSTTNITCSSSSSSRGAPTDCHSSGAATVILPNLYHSHEQDDGTKMQTTAAAVPALAMPPSYGMRKW